MGKTLTKNTIVQIDATPFKQYYKQHYGIAISKKGTEKEDTAAVKLSRHVLAKHKGRQESRVLEEQVEQQLANGRILAAISSRPGQTGRCDGYILEGEELQFYLKKLDKKKKH